MDFDDLKEYAQIEYEMTQDGILVQKDKLKIPSVKPHCDADMQFLLPVPDKGKIYLKLIYRLKKRFLFWKKVMYLALMRFFFPILTEGISRK